MFSRRTSILRTLGDDGRWQLVAAYLTHRHFLDVPKMLARVHVVVVCDCLAMQWLGDRLKSLRGESVARNARSCSAVRIGWVDGLNDYLRVAHMMGGDRGREVFVFDYMMI